MKLAKRNPIEFYVHYVTNPTHPPSEPLVARNLAGKVAHVRLPLAWHGRLCYYATQRSSCDDGKEAWQEGGRQANHTSG